MSARSWKILLAHADRALLRQVSKFLNVLGYDVAAAATADTALAAVETFAPDFLLLDARLPPLGGREVCRSARSRSGADYLYVFFLVTNPAAAELIDAVETGADDFLVQPMVYGELMSRLRSGARTIEFERRLREQTVREPLSG